MERLYGICGQKTINCLLLSLLSLSKKNDDSLVFERIRITYYTPRIRTLDLREQKAHVPEGPLPNPSWYTLTRRERSGQSSGFIGVFGILPWDF